MSWITPLDNDEVARLLPDVLQRPDDEGARLVALHWLHQLISMRERWRLIAAHRDSADRANTNGDGPGAVRSPAPASSAEMADVLHKARVALRRLRAVFREHDDLLNDVLGRKMSQHLRQLGRKTNALRDTDVQREWLQAEAEGLGDAAREEAEQLRAQLGEDASAPEQIVERAFVKHFDSIERKLLKRLSWFARIDRVGTGPLPQPVYAAAVAERLAVGVEEILADVERIGEDADAESSAVQDELHDIRLHLKRHRAMLAPIVKQHAALASLYDLATRGQDMLGAMRDADLLAGIAREAGLNALTSALSATRLSNAEAFLQQWVRRRSDVERAYDRAIEALRAMAYSMPAPSARTNMQPIDVPMEIERKYLLTGVPPEAVAMPPILIEQGWIPGTLLRERLRRNTYPDGRVRCTRTVKLGAPEARIEIEEDTGNAIFQALWALTTSARIRKHRHVVREGAHAWEIDSFLDRELVLAEVELASESDRAPIPDWLAPYIVRDVTGDPSYLNSQMARPDVAQPPQEPSTT